MTPKITTSETFCPKFETFFRKSIRVPISFRVPITHHTQCSTCRTCPTCASSTRSPFVRSIHHHLGPCLPHERRGLRSTTWPLIPKAISTDFHPELRVLLLVCLCSCACARMLVPVCLCSSCLCCRVLVLACLCSELLRASRPCCAVVCFCCRRLVLLFCFVQLCGAVVSFCCCCKSAGGVGGNLIKILKLGHFAAFLGSRISLVMPSTPNSERGGVLP